MFNIQLYLEKFIKLGYRNEEIKKTIQNVLKDILGKEISLSNIIFNRGIVEVREGTAYRNMIFIKKNIILDSLKKAGINANDIR